MCSSDEAAFAAAIDRPIERGEGGSGEKAFHVRSPVGRGDDCLRSLENTMHCSSATPIAFFKPITCQNAPICWGDRRPPPVAFVGRNGGTGALAHGVACNCWRTSLAPPRPCGRSRSPRTVCRGGGLRGRWRVHRGRDGRRRAGACRRRGGPDMIRIAITRGGL